MEAPVTLSLDGLWDFFYTPQKFTPPMSALPDGREFTGKMVTPGYWDDHYELFDEEDFFGLTARFNPDYRPPHFPMGRTLSPHAASSFLVGTGFYRKRITVKEGFRCAVLEVGPAMWGCCVYCNGNFAGQMTGYSTAGEFILDDFLRPGEENEIVIAVCNLRDDGGAYYRLDGTHDGMPFGSRPGQHRGLAAQGYQSERGGIGGGVSLKLSSGAVFADHFISFADGVPLWHVESRGAPAELSWRMSRHGETVDEGTLPIDGEAEFTSAAPSLRWSDRHPELYDVELTLRTDGRVSDSARFRWGARQIAADGMELRVNGIPTFFRGVTEHCYFPETANPHFDKEKYLRDLWVLRAAGFNFIRCHTWCPPEPFFDACDELGFFVQTELTPVWSFDEAEAIIRLIRRHPCAVIFCEGNEKIIDEFAILRLQKLVRMFRRMAPGMLFDPQSAMRGIEYEFAPGRRIVQSPLQHDPEPLERVRRFSDCFSILGGEFSYEHDTFPGRDAIEARNAVYRRPCLSHESGILGGYLDFSLEERYRGTWIGTGIFENAREQMKKHGAYDRARLFYEKNSLFISSCRKQLIENMRSCRNMAGFDYLGGIDTHWHVLGYPCGVFNEFYEEKFGESVADVRRYCGESILLCTAGNRRNLAAGGLFAPEIEFTCFEEEDLPEAHLFWSLETINEGTVIASGENTAAGLRRGKVEPVGALRVTLPEYPAGKALILRARLTAGEKEWENRWNFWVFPAAGAAPLPETVRETDRLSPELIDFLVKGGRVLLTGDFPADMETEMFRSHTSGRVTGHAGGLMHDHPIWEKYPHDDFMDWQFFPLMGRSHALIRDEGMPPFAPIFELIPSFKMVKHKSMLSEFDVGGGRLMICGFRLDADDPGAKYMHRLLREYLGGDALAAAPQWEADDLKERLERMDTFKRTDIQGWNLDDGGRPMND